MFYFCVAASMPCFWLSADLSAGDSAHGVSSIPMVDTDALNANLALLALHLLQKYRPDAFPESRLDLSSPATAQGLDARPPCRWEEHTYLDPASGAEVEVVLDMGHNPAALAALARRIAYKFPGRPVRYFIAVIPICVHCMRTVGLLTLTLSVTLTLCVVSPCHLLLLRMVYAMSRDKDVRTCLKNVLAVVPPSHIHFVQVVFFA